MMVLSRQRYVLSLLRSVLAYHSGLSSFHSAIGSTRCMRVDTTSHAISTGGETETRDDLKRVT
jgi:hypothetical protein